MVRVPLQSGLSGLARISHIIRTYISGAEYSCPSNLRGPTVYQLFQLSECHIPWQAV